MTNAKIKNATDNCLIVALVQEHCTATKRQLTTGNLVQACRNINRIQDEMLRRGLLTEHDIELLNQ